MPKEEISKVLIKLYGSAETEMDAASSEIWITDATILKTDTVNLKSIKASFMRIEYITAVLKVSSVD